jgi:glutamate-1-semialdehyde aminotransferase
MKVSTVIANLRKRQGAYEEFTRERSQRARMLFHPSMMREAIMLEAARYEGIAIGTRWAKEDLLKVRTSK